MVATITRNELREALDQGRDITVVESLGEDDFKEAHLPGAVNIPREQVAQLAPKRLPDKAAEIVVYCANTKCQSSAETAQALVDLGYRNVRDYEAGKQDWIDAGLPVESGRTSTTHA